MPHREQEADQAALREMKATIAEHGWAVLGIHPTEGDRSGSVPFAYTAGLTVAGLPELFVNGLPHATAQYVLNQTARIALGRVVELGDGDQIPAADAKLSVDLRIATCATSGHLGVARALYGHKRVTCLQVLWPDTHGVWPDNPDFHGHQPIGPAD